MRKLKVLLIFDSPTPVTPDMSVSSVLSIPERKAENHVHQALKSLGHDIKLLSIYDDVNILTQGIADYQPDIIFNQAEQFCGDSSYEKNLVGLFEMLQVPYTGSGSTGIMLSKNKGVAKKILSHHRIKTPAFAILHRGQRVGAPKKLKYPVIIKPIRDQASYGISMNSLVDNDTAYIERVQFVHDSMAQDAIAEEFVQGRELYVSILGNKRLQVFPVREMVFEQMPEDEPKIATFKAKWDEAYRKKWGIKNVFASDLSDDVIHRIEKTAKKVFNYLNMKGYGRLDLRLTAENEVVVIEANPNPYIAKDEDFGKSAAKAGIEYNDLIARILSYGLNP